MKALFAFIVMAIVIVVLIEFNERRKAKNRHDDITSSRHNDDCDKDQDCSGCGLVDVCEKKTTSK